MRCLSENLVASTDEFNKVLSLFPTTGRYLHSAITIGQIINIALFCSCAEKKDFFRGLTVSHN